MNANQVFDVACIASMIQDAQERETIVIECKIVGVIVDASLPLVILRERRDAAMRGES